MELARASGPFKVEYKGKCKLLVAKHNAERLEEEIGKLKEAKMAPHLKDVKKILTEKPTSGIKNEDKSGKPEPEQRKTLSKSCWLLAL